ncbi:hypothetical protein D3H65_06435 [Paraflavitalea soli]|uniref:DUF4248 domain-containing protein n=1 Tax=Paraflavitalea soli TaxID=2315862 RepID=A0A3B7MK56_9BACT|nr:hypothetical protein [Paraflavitalea soli]AXY73639.1 hypothetical protein D3H65_06435 [Paraflavitalea soli]
MKPTILEIKPYTHKELSDLYEVCKQTFTKWLRPFKAQIGERQGHFYSVGQVRIIFDCLGVPYSIADGAGNLTIGQEMELSLARKDRQGDACIRSIERIFDNPA